MIRLFALAVPSDGGVSGGPGERQSIGDLAMMIMWWQLFARAGQNYKTKIAIFLTQL